VAKAKKTAEKAEKKLAPKVAKAPRPKMSDFKPLKSVKAVIDGLTDKSLKARGAVAEYKGDKLVIKSVIGQGTAVYFDGDKPKSGTWMKALADLGVRVSNLDATVS